MYPHSYELTKYFKAVVPREFSDTEMRSKRPAHRYDKYLCWEDTQAMRRREKKS